VGDAGKCIAPPYDVIDAQEQERLHEQSEYGIVRIIKGIGQPGDSDQNNVYTRAAATLTAFIEQGALKQDQHESIYVYAQDFTVRNETYRRTGFIALGKLEGYSGSIRPHEQTLAGPKADRLNLMCATKCQIGQIFMMYSEPQKTIDRLLGQACTGPELLSYEDDQQVTHRLFALTDRQAIKAIQAVMAETHVFIADGHHRYETALNYFTVMKPH